MRIKKTFTVLTAAFCAALITTACVTTSAKNDDMIKDDKMEMSSDASMMKQEKMEMASASSKMKKDKMIMEAVLDAEFTCTLPAASGPGIKIAVMFKKDGGFSISALYLERSEKAETETGKWEIEDGLIKTSLEMRNNEYFYFKIIDKDSIKFLGPKDSEISPEMEQLYILKKTK